MKTVINGGAYVGWATLDQPNICAECWADKALAQPMRWPAFKNAVLHAIAL